MNTNYQNYSESIQTKTNRLLKNYNELKRVYFLTIIGSVWENPKCWSKTKIESERALKIEIGKPLRKQDFNSYGQYPVYGGHGKLGVHSEAIFEKNRIIIGRVGSHAGNVFVNYASAWVTNNAMVIHIDEQKYLVEYFAQMLRMMNLNRLATGVAQPHISISTIKKQKILAPPLEVQNKLVRYLNIINSLESKSKVRNDHFKKLVSKTN